jgi:hypothetical protein
MVIFAPPTNSRMATVVGGISFRAVLLLAAFSGSICHVSTDAF